MVARIYSPAKNAMQSGQGKSKQWFLEYEPENAKLIEPLMGYTSTVDIKNQIKLKFDSKEDAIAFSEKNNIAYRVEEPHIEKRRRIAYSDNFRFDRQKPWTH